MIKQYIKIADDQIVSAIQWDVCTSTFNEIKELVGLNWKPGMMGTDTFYILQDSEEGVVSLICCKGDYVVKIGDKLQVLSEDQFSQSYEHITSGIYLIRKERFEQLNKHGRSIERDLLDNTKFQLSTAASRLCDNITNMHEIVDNVPHGWDPVIWMKMVHKPYKDRLIIAGALIAAEIDRLNLFDSNS